LKTNRNVPIQRVILIRSISSSVLFFFNFPFLFFFFFIDCRSHCSALLQQFIEFRRAILQCVYPCGEEDAVMLAGIACQADGDWDPQRHVSYDVLLLSECIARVVLIYLFNAAI
jgi:hypothetical protein